VNERSECNPGYSSDIISVAEGDEQSAAGITFRPYLRAGLCISDRGLGFFKIYYGLLDLLNLLIQTEKLSQGWDKMGQAA
jgi:hypothetical protein